jgi:partner of Y14 and mago protein
VESVTKLIKGIAISESPTAASTNANDGSQPESSAPDIDKKIRALKKKVFLSPSLSVCTFFNGKANQSSPVPKFISTISLVVSGQGLVCFVRYQVGFSYFW